MSLLGRLLINAAALWVAIRLVPGVSFTGEWWRLFCRGADVSLPPVATPIEVYVAELGQLFHCR